MTFIDQWLRPDIKNINAYHIPNSKNLLKLDAMESPFGVPQDQKDEFLKYIEQDFIQKTIQLTKRLCLTKLLSGPLKFFLTKFRRCKGFHSGWRRSTSQ